MAVDGGEMTATTVEARSSKEARSVRNGAVPEDSSSVEEVDVIHEVAFRSSKRQHG
ncbi:hypothetical protein M6B38_269380 [Iris pallida]|uniref:Uncharacterized protein n=1 Tax=Iris pallida TaxID=29817 RepID=A0AAX6I8J0_IRIPA|nr:hypothetical protein M6B38_269380 [Iris pallida]